MLLAALLGVLAGPARAADRPLVLLIGIDGFRADYLDRGVTPTLSALAAQGVRAEGGMRPSFPSVTFPNFYTLATGLQPDEHGLVYNRMTDPALPGRTFGLSVAAEKTQPVWYEGGEPVWVKAEKAGMKTATMFWPGSEVRIRGVRPTYWLPYAQSVPSAARVDMLLQWLTLPRDEAPGFATLYFDVVDSAGHRYGPDAPETTAAVKDVDAQIGRLLAGLKAAGIAVNVVVVADHGMAPLSRDRVVFWDEWVSPADVQVLSSGPLLMLDPAPGRQAAVEAALIGRKPHAECWRKGEIPARLRYGKNRRVPAIVCLAETGWLVIKRSDFKPDGEFGGAHGYDNADPLMRALFVAAGPDLKVGATVREADSVEVEPLVRRLLGLPVGAAEGPDLAAALR